jgi:hypothetical protein
LQETSIQFKDALASVVSDQIDTVIGKALASNRSTDTMTNLKAIAKALGLSDSATDDQVIAAITAQSNIAKMSAAHKNFMEKDGKMPSGGKEAYTAMSPSERDAHIEKNPLAGEEDGEDESDGEMEKMITKGDAFKTPGGKIYSKRDFGGNATMFEFAKSQNAQLIDNQDKLAKSEDQRLRGEFAKRAEPLTLIGKADEIGALLFAIAKLDSKIAGQVEEVFKVLNTRLEKSALFEETGSNKGAGSFSKAGARIDALAEELLKKEPDLFKNVRLDRMSVARAEIRKRQPELKKAEDDERAEQSGKRRAA